MENCKENAPSGMPTEVSSTEIADSVWAVEATLTEIAELLRDIAGTLDKNL